MFAQLSLSKKINIFLVLLAIIFLSTTVVFFWFDEKELSEKFVRSNLENLALNYFDSINTMMITGTAANRKIAQEKALSQEEIVEARIIRAPKLIEVFGKGFDDQAAQNDFERNALNGNKEFRHIEQDGKEMMTFAMPIIAKSDYRGTNCLMCHQVTEGEILGAIKITYDLTNVNNDINESVIRAGVLQLIITAICFALLSYMFSRLVIFRLNRLQATIKDVEQNLDLNKTIKVNYHDELGSVSIALNSMMSKFKDAFSSFSSASEQMMVSAKNVDEISSLTREAVLSQKNGTDSVAAAINELDASAHEVQSNTELAAEKSVLASQSASQSLELVESAKVGINQLRDQVVTNTSMITELNNKTNEVGSVLEVITSIADQTNLLALNAAIEAARAGEHGRGFAVVADEVRSLATRTRESIEQIQATIGNLQVDAGQAVSSMNEVSEQASEKAKDVTDVASLLEGIANQIIELDELNCQISNAAKQQNIAADEINKNVVDISNVAEQSSEDAIKGKQISEELLELSYELKNQLSKFKF